MTPEKDLKRPVTTYRLQLHKDFTFRDAARWAEYLKNLGATDVYFSPCLLARAGSLHGYDIGDHNRFNPELGGEEGFEGLSRELRTQGLGIVMDFVPNHMSADASANPWWRDVLENGRASPYAGYFDIDWRPAKQELRGKILLPILGDQYGRVLERGELALKFEDGVFYAQYFDHRIPIDPREWPRVLRHGLETLEKAAAPEDPFLREFLSVITALEKLPSRDSEAVEHQEERRREKEVCRERLKRLMEGSPEVREHLRRSLSDFNGHPGRPESFDLLHELLENQAYRLAHWRTARHEINYRRFFDVNDLIGVRMEAPSAFEKTHSLLLGLIREGRISGLRLDHIDGLFNPADYLRTLRAAIGREGFLIVVEKILSAGELLRSDWPVQGTTGYDFLNDLSGLFLDAQGIDRLRLARQRFTGSSAPVSADISSGKRLIMNTSMSSELNVLAYYLNRLSESDRNSRDFTLESLRAALREICVYFPRYRTYVDKAGAAEWDRLVVRTAVALARRENPAMEASIFDFIQSVLLAEKNAEYLHFAMKFQQFTGPVQAKGVEDTAFYRHNVLISLNEVGSRPEEPAISVTGFHQRNRARLERWPRGLICTDTHDTKRGEDSRARLNVLSEIPDLWRRHASAWRRMNQGNRTASELEGEAPDRNDEYLFYQSLIGAWPSSRLDAQDGLPPGFMDRMQAFMLKAIREAKVHTSWINTNGHYEEAVRNFVDRCLAGPRSGEFLGSLLNFLKPVARWGAVSSLSQVILKMASPGVPDFYQGTELWNLSLVDPDNRRPVDFEARTALLNSLEPILAEGLAPEKKAEAVRNLLENWEDGAVKMYVTACGLRHRRRHPDIFLEGDYLPLASEGKWAAHTAAFARKKGNQCVVVVAPRLATRLTSLDRPWPMAEVWEDTRLLWPEELPLEGWRNILTGDSVSVLNAGQAPSVPVASILRNFPAAILSS